MRVGVGVGMRMTLPSCLGAEYTHRLVENEECRETSKDCSSTISAMTQLRCVQNAPNDDIPLLLDDDCAMMSMPMSFSPFTKEGMGNEVEKDITE
jgi:hypothetical protein